MRPRLALLLFAVLAAALFVPRSEDALAREPNLRDSQLETDLSGRLAQFDGSYGIVVVNLSDGRQALVNPSTPFPTASLYKLLVMYRVFQAMDAGSIAGGDQVDILDSDELQDEPDGGVWAGEEPTLEQALTAMITVSSNAAAFALARTVGGWEIVESAAPEIGMTHTSFDGEDFWSTPEDVALFFQRLAQHTLISPRASQRMIRLLLHQTVDDRLPALLPTQASVAHKTGELDDVRNDAGIVYAPGGWYVVVMMSSGDDPESLVEAEAQASYLVYQRYGAVQQHPTS